MPVKKLPGILTNKEESEAPLDNQAATSGIEPAPKALGPEDNFCPHCTYKSTYWKNTDWLEQYVDQHGTLISCYHCYKPFSFKWAPNPPYSPTTQKAKGVMALWRGMRIGLGGIKALKPNLIIPVKKDPNEALLTKIKNLLPQFVRPCPPNPEHGFVESRDVTTMEEFEQILKETREANEDSELMFTHKVNADLNVLWVPSMLTIGPGHDGATAGKNTISVPLAGVNGVPKEVLDEASLKPNAAPYIEAVIQGVYKYLTQLRGGPPLESLSPDFIPAPFVVTSIVQTNGEDLLEWAKKVKSLKGKEGVVVWHPGGSLTDHYSVHCRENNVPILITKEPHIGDELVSENPPQDLDPQSMLRGLVVGDTMDYDDKHAMTLLLLIALHNSVALRGPHSFWLGVAVAAICKLGVAACEAEARHAHQAYKGMTSKPDLYGYYCARKLSFLRARLSRVTQILHYGFGDPAEKKGYGGRKWALCGAALVPLFNGIKALVQAPTSENASSLVLALNVAVNQAHNGGWWLNKFCDVGAYDRVPAGHPNDYVAAAPAFWSASQVNQTLSDKVITRFMSTVSKWPDTEIKPLRWRKVSLDIIPGAFTLNLKASTVPTPKVLTIPATPSMISKMLAVAGEIKIDRGTINFVDPDGNVTNLWSEVPLVAEARDVKSS